MWKETRMTIVGETEQVAPTPAAAEQSPASAQAEIEIKFQADRQALEAVLAARQLKGAVITPERELISTYFDTPGRDLQRRGFALRLRRKGRSIPVLGLKWSDENSADPFARGEVEARAPGGEPNLDAFEPDIRARLTDVVADQPLTPVFKTQVKRRTALIHHGRSDIELAFDDGILMADGQSRALTELELELKSGNTADLLALARELTTGCGLSLAFEPKAGRGYRLSEGAVAQPQKARPLHLLPASSFDDAIAAVIAGCLAHFTANWAALRESDAPESVHQLRVALRRLRSALGIFRKRIAMPELEDIRSRARHIASALGPARECDAFRQNALAGPFRDQPKRVAAAAPLFEAVERRRQEAYVAARHIIDDPETSVFVLDVQAFLVQRAWRTALDAGELGLLTRPAQDFATEVLERLRRRALKRGKHLPDMPDGERHELRIALKKLRYATEFFGTLYGEDKAVRSFLRLVADLQEDLGAHNDAATAEEFIASLDLTTDAQAHFAGGYLLGFYRHATVIADTHLARKWKNFRRAATFWA